MTNIDMLKSIIIRSFPEILTKEIEKINFEKIEEIRIRVGSPVILRTGCNEIILKYIVNSEEILNILQNFCSNSIYTYQNQICNGFVTIPGGHRVGISGTVVIKDNKVSNISNIYSLNIRIAHMVKGSSNNLLQYIINFEQNTIYNTLIVSPPGARQNNSFKGLGRKDK